MAFSSVVFYPSFVFYKAYYMNPQHLSIAVYGIQDINSSAPATLSHDHAIAVMNQGKLIYHAQLERLDRVKHSKNMPKKILGLLKEKNLLNAPCDFVFVDNVLGRSFINTEGNIRFEAPLCDSLNSGLEAGTLWWLDRARKAYALNHELAHIASCLPFYGDFKENSLLVHFDGGASKSNFSAWHFKQNKIKLIKADWDLKHLSSLFNSNALMFGILDAKAFELNSVPGKLMGFASYGKARKDILAWLKQNNFFEDLWKSKSLFFKKVKEDFGIELKHLSQKDPFIQDIAATVHEYFLNESMKQFKALKEETGAKFLYYSGGSALSIVLNTRIVEAELFEEIFIPPCCNDSGLALGAACFMEKEKGHRIEKQNGYINNWSIEEYETITDSTAIEKCAELILQNKVIGICNGIAEIGPRALGNRSIICLASSKEVFKKVSMDVKKREWYRPVAPIMLLDNAKYFTGLNTINDLAQYMLLDFNILKERQQEIKGALHIDKTARIQTINRKEDNPFMHALLQHLDTKHQIKALINTSFNRAGEPIVHSTEDAIKSAREMSLDALVLNGKLVLIN